MPTRSSPVFLLRNTLKHSQFGSQSVCRPAIVAQLYHPRTGRLLLPNNSFVRSQHTSNNNNNNNNNNKAIRQLRASNPSIRLSSSSSAAYTPLPRSRYFATMPPIERITDQLEKPALDDRDYRVIRLPNKLEALLVHDPDTDKASAALNVNVGNFSDDDSNPGLAGLAHSVEHMLFMGTEKVWASAYLLPIFENCPGKLQRCIS